MPTAIAPTFLAETTTVRPAIKARPLRHRQLSASEITGILLVLGIGALSLSAAFTRGATEPTDSPGYRAMP